MPEEKDEDLVVRFARGGSDEAFATLVARYVNLVYSAALRFTRDHDAAEEISQAVFIIFARKAGNLRHGTPLGGWLYQTARLTASNFVKIENRRRRREQEAYMRSTEEESEAVAWEQVAPLLDHAMGELGETDRHAVVLRYFENKSGAEVAQTLNVSEAAAHKRVGRALEKLRRFFSRNGLVLSTTLIASVLSIHSVQAAPPALAATISATAGQGTAATVSTVVLVKGVLKIMAWTKAKAATGAALILIFVAGTATVAVRAVKASRAARYPSIHGAWEGTVKVPQLNSQLRLVFNVTKAGPAYTATMESVDQGAKAIPVTDIQYDYPRVRLETKTIGGVFEGRLDTNTSVMTGTWRQGAVNLPLSIKRTDSPSSLAQALPDSNFAPRAGSEVQGVWRGALEVNGTTLRLALKVAESSDGKLQVQMDSLDQGARNIPSTLAYYQKPALTAQFSGINATFEGNLSASGKEIDGTWTQMGQSWPLLVKLGGVTDEAGPEAAPKSFAPAGESDLVGHWKGTLSVKDVKLRLRLEVGKRPDGKFDCNMVSIDQGGVRIPASAVRWNPPEARLEWQSIGATFVGKVQKQKFSGTWQQGGGSLPFSMERTTAE